jgi:hypothetical protein
MNGATDREWLWRTIKLVACGSRRRCSRSTFVTGGVIYSAHTQATRTNSSMPWHRTVFQVRGANITSGRLTAGGGNSKSLSFRGRGARGCGARAKWLGTRRDVQAERALQVALQEGKACLACEASRWIEVAGSLCPIGAQSEDKIA